MAYGIDKLNETLKILIYDFGGGNTGGFYGGYDTQPDLDIYIKVNVTMEDAYYGASKPVKFKRNAMCETCNGTGAEGGILVTCPTCHGTGKERISRGQGFFNFVQVIVCRTCNGRGKIPKTPCKVCNGKGYIPKMENISITIPKGVDTNTRLRTQKLGNSFGGVTGDLYAVVYVQQNPNIKRTGDNLYVFHFRNIALAIADFTWSFRYFSPAIACTAHNNLYEIEESLTT